MSSQGVHSNQLTEPLVLDCKNGMRLVVPDYIDDQTMALMSMAIEDTRVDGMHIIPRDPGDIDDQTKNLMVMAMRRGATISCQGGQSDQPTEPLVLDCKNGMRLVVPDHIDDQTMALMSMAIEDTRVDGMHIIPRDPGDIDDQTKNLMVMAMRRGAKIHIPDEIKSPSSSPQSSGSSPSLLSNI